jgi:hypothetical protein
MEMMSALNAFTPLQTAIAHVESWRIYLNASYDDLCGKPAQDLAAIAENTVDIGVLLGELLSITWRAVFNSQLRSSAASWSTVSDFEALRKDLRALFYTTREAMEGASIFAQKIQTRTGEQPAGLNRLLTAIDDGRKLEESVFRDWPSFIEPQLSVDALAVEESLAEVLGIRVEEARQKMDARRRQLNAKPE